jgi:hypothetical protein
VSRKFRLQVLFSSQADLLVDGSSRSAANGSLLVAMDLYGIPVGAQLRVMQDVCLNAMKRECY